MSNKPEKGLNISVRSFLTAIAVIFALMVGAYLLTFLIPGGTYSRIPDANGNLVIDTAAGFSYTDGGIPFWKWLLPLFLCWALPAAVPSSLSSPFSLSSAAYSTAWTSVV